MSGPLRTSTEKVICEAGEGTDDPDLAVRTVGDQLIGSMESWDEFPYRARGGAFARAVGIFHEKDCSAWLVTPSLLVTARHCMRDSGFEQGDVREVYFGDMRDSEPLTRLANASAERSAAVLAGEFEASRRLWELGVSFRDADRSGDFGEGQALKWTCEYVWDGPVESSLIDDDVRDISALYCGEHVFSGDHGSVEVYPGDIWGEYDLWEDAVKEDLLTGVGHSFEFADREGGYFRRTKAYSYTGLVIDADSFCPWERSGGSCFRFTSDILPGSSGGVVVERRSQLAAGLAVAEYPEDTREPVDCGAFDGNIALRFPTELHQMDRLAIHGRGEEGGVPPGAAEPIWVPQRTVPTATTMGTPSPTGWLPPALCDDNQYVTGVIGTTNKDGFIGNLGFVCEDYVGPEAKTHRLGTATVVASGSRDTTPLDYGDRAQVPRKYRQYRSDRLSATEASWPSREIDGSACWPLPAEGCDSVAQLPTQSELFCPPQTYLRALEIDLADGKPGALGLIECAPWSDSGTTYSRRPLRPIGVRSGETIRITCEPGKLWVGADFNVEFLPPLSDETEQLADSLNAVQGRCVRVPGGVE